MNELNLAECSEGQLEEILQRIADENDKRKASKLMLIDAACQKIVHLRKDSGCSKAEVFRRLQAAFDHHGTKVGYRHPETMVTWTGKGRKPGWVVELEKAGTLDECKIS